MPNYDFRKDLPIARKTEQEVAGILEKAYGLKIHTANNKDNRYDILGENKLGSKFTFEVKEDFTCERTGNVGLEFECRGKPSGIAVSQAEFYIYKLHTPKDGIEFYLFNTNFLKRMVEEERYFRIVNGGDEGSNSMNYLFKLDVFRKFGKRIASIK